MQSSRSSRSSRSNADSTGGYSEMLVEDLNISEAIARRLVRNGIVTVSQLQSLCTDDLYRLYWIGRGSVGEIQAALMELGLEPLGRHAPRQTIKRIK